MPFNPSLPAENSPVVSGELRGQFVSLFENTQSRAFEDDCINRTLGSARNPGGVAPLGLVVSDPPTQAEVQAVADKVDELITALKRP